MDPEKWMTAFVAMWTEREQRTARHRDAIEDAVKRLRDGAPAWEVADRLDSHLAGMPVATAQNEQGATR